jgi:aspartyl/asparaginyl-tRNA synthetase
MATIYTPLAEKALVDQIGCHVTILGQVRKIRLSGKKQGFIEVGYADQQIQAVAFGAEIVLIVKSLSIQSYCEFAGVIKALPEGKTSAIPVELQVETIKVVSTCASDYEQQCPSDAGPDIKLEKRHFYFRDPKFALIMRCHAFLLRAIREHFYETSCLEITPPVFTGVECEGGATLFKLAHPGKSSDKPITAFLTQVRNSHSK